MVPVSSPPEKECDLLGRMPWCLSLWLPLLAIPHSVHTLDSHFPGSRKDFLSYLHVHTDEFLLNIGILEKLIASR